MLLFAVNRWLRVLAAVGVVGAAVALRADDVVVVPGTTSDQGQDNSGVFVGDSAIALERMALAQRMEKLAEWGKSADLYQEILSKYTDKVVPVTPTEGDRVVQYTSVTEAVCQAMCKWPPEGLDVYRSKYEGPAASLLSKVGSGHSAADLDILHQVFWNYFPSDSGKAAGIRLMDAYFEMGDNAAVVQIGRRLLHWHPNLGAERALTLYRTALAEKLNGEMNGVRDHAKELREKFPQAVGTIRGTDTALADSLDQELASGGSAAYAMSDSWVTVGGDETRDKLSHSTMRPGARLYSISLSTIGPGRSTDANGNRVQVQPNNEGVRQNGAALGVMPVVDRGEMFFQDNAKVYAVNLETGGPLPGWETTWPGQNGCYQLTGGAGALPPGQQFCVTLSDKSVVAVMGLPNENLGVPMMAPAQTTRLVCLDRETGKQNWTTSVTELPESASRYRRLQIAGAPLIVGDNVYVIGQGEQNLSFEECRRTVFQIERREFRGRRRLRARTTWQVSFPMRGAGAGDAAVASGVCKRAGVCDVEYWGGGGAGCV